ncbi:MAG: TolC family protein [Candidatus Eremiobacteraeota bacterium]|nr:TolC family protein [Candidatus Eremiobacteraeota bacterium]MBC5827787.1 TolC family protein [Candidatus Eremiobacteraeota bacterium]
MPRFWSLVAAVATALAVAAPALADGSAQSPSPLSLAQAVDFALAHNASVLQAQAQVASAGSVLARDRSLELPLIAGQAQSVLDRQSANNAGSLAQFGLRPSPNFSQNTAQLLGSQNVLNLTDTLQAKQAKHAYDSTVENLRLAREQVTLNVDSGYYALVQNSNIAALDRSDELYQRALLQIAQANFKAGRVAGIDTLKAQVQLTTAQERHASALADVADAGENLGQVIGAPPGTSFIIAATVPQPEPKTTDLAVLRATALANRPEVAIAGANLQNALLSNGLVDAPNLPSVALNGGYGNQVSPTTNAAFVDQCIASNNNPNRPPTIPIQNCSPGTSHFYNIGLTSTWTLPIVDWGATHAAHRSAYSAIDQQRAALDLARNQTTVDVDQAVRRLQVDKENVGLAQANARLAKQAADIAQVQYRLGVISQVDVTSAEQSYQQAARDLLAAQVGYALAVDKVELATGSL